jgi:hypothetical protein
VSHPASNRIVGLASQRRDLKTNAVAGLGHHHRQLATTNDSNAHFRPRSPYLAAIYFRC